ncbi:MAG TPA: sugar phosphate isomerase/epimerase [Gemmataceae bacterium]|jgi:sugar phosphate isomerase/epimerase
MTEDRHTFDRRRFLRVSASAALSLSAAPNFLRAEEKKDDAFGGFKLGAQSYTFREFDLEPALKRMKDLGLRYAEFYQKHVPRDSSPKQKDALLKLCKEYDVTPLAWGVQRFSKNTDANREIFEFGKAFGLKMFSADPDPDSFDSLDKLCEEYKIAIGIHPHGPQGKKEHRWYSAQVILKAVKDHHPLIGSCLDTGHLIRAAQLGDKLDPAEQIRLMGARNFGIHLKDHDNERREDVIFGRGVLDVPGVLKALRAVKFQGLISIEYEAHPKDPSADVRACVQVVKESVKKLG